MNDRLNARTHQLLVEQAERLEQQREAMRKAMLYAPLRTPADLPRRACSHCESGMSRCVTPQACERAEQGKGRAVAKLTRAIKGVGSRAERVAVGIVLIVVAALVAWAIAEAALIAAGVML